MNEMPATSDQPLSAKRCSRRFQFSLRSLLILMAICCAIACWISAQVRTVCEREVLRQQFGPVEGVWKDMISKRHPTRVSWVRRILGDEAEVWFILSEDASNEDVDRVRAAFPEAEVDQEPLL